MSNLKARELLNFTTEQLQESLPDHFNVMFEDGEIIESTKRQLIYSSFFWDIHRHYVNTPILKTHHVNHVLKGKPLSAKTHIELLGIIFNDVSITYNLHLPQEKEHLLSMVMDVTNNLYNKVKNLAEAYVASVDILDFIEVVRHPRIDAANKACEPNPESIAKTYKEVLDCIENDPSLNNNGLAKAVRSKMVNANQVLQCISVRGFPTEVDGAIIGTPILSNYTEGMRSLFNFAAESRSAAKSLYFSEAPLQEAEYFARRLQLLAMTVERIHYVDCGSKDLIEWRVSPPLFDEKGNKTYAGDLPFMIGKICLDETTGKYFEITKDDPALHNKVIKFRSAVLCKHPDHHGVCEVCFGGLSRNVSRFANLGHLCAATMTQQSSQSVLSTKHLDASSVSTAIELGDRYRKFFHTNKQKNAYLIHPEFKEKSCKIIINRDETFGLNDILHIEDIDNINPLRISSIESLDISFEDKKGLHVESFFVNQGNRKAVLTSEFLAYLKLRRWETDQKGNFVFTLDEWDFKLPILALPDMEYSYSDHSHQIAKLIESSVKSLTDKTVPNSPIVTLQDLFTLVNTKLNVNIACLEILVYANMVPDKDQFALSRFSVKPILGVADQVIKNRSLAPAYVYEDTSMTISNPRSFYKLDRPDSPFDVFLAPREVVNAYKNKDH